MKLFKELLDGNTDGVKPSKCIEHKTHDEAITSAGAKAHEVWKKTSPFWKQYLVSEPSDPAVAAVKTDDAEQSEQNK